MKLVFAEHAWEDYLWWQGPGRETGLDRVDTVLREARRTPFKGVGKSEPLRNDLTA
ncbi:MAG: type II toxin-antitoxin system YoeB family toxin [Pseudomonadota bacterium]